MSKQYDIEQLVAIENMLSPEERAARDTVRHWVATRYLPELEQAHRQGVFPTKLLPELAELGVFGANIQGYECAGMNNVAYGLCLQELERGDSGLRSLVSVQGSLAMYAIYRFGSETQRQQWLPKMARGELIGCFGLTEPNSGSDPASMQTRAQKDGDHYILNGVKTWITNSPIAHLAVIWAKVEDEEQNIRGFVVERGHGGFETPEIAGKLSLRASPTGEIHLNDCRVPLENLLPQSDGLKSPLSCLNQARAGIGWGITGAALACYETALDYTLERKQFDRSLASFQLVQQNLVEMAMHITNSQLMSLHYSRLKDAGALSPIQVSMHKRHNVWAAREVAKIARPMLGANGVSDAYPIMRHLMNIESVYTYEGTHEIHTLAIGRALTGLNAFY